MAGPDADPRMQALRLQRELTPLVAQGKFQGERQRGGARVDRPPPASPPPRRNPPPPPRDAPPQRLLRWPARSGGWTRGTKR